MAIKTPEGSVLDIPRGTNDFGPADSILLKEIIEVVEEVFKRYGFYPIHTPSIENTQVLSAKAYGDEAPKEMFIIEGGDSALRFDLTVPLARFVAMNKDLPLPFKRYQIGNVWRKDEPQKMREREFVQADVDIVGSKDIQSDAECIAVMCDALAGVGIQDFMVMINSRGVLNSILTSFGLKSDSHSKAIRIIDKMSKTSVNDTIKQLTDMGTDQNSAESLVKFITSGSTNDEKLAQLAGKIPELKPETDRMKELLGLLSSYGIIGDVKIDFSLARGLDYYTGFVWEAAANMDGARTLSIASGGRYDNLIGMYSKSPAPAVGSSLGISRIFELLQNRAENKTYADIFIANIGKENVQYSIEVAKKLRTSGIHVDMNVTERGISKQLEYSGNMGFKYVAIIGNKERTAQKVNLRNMSDGTEELIDVAGLITKLKK